MISPSPPPLAKLSKKFDYIFIKNNLLYIGASTKSGKIASFCRLHDIKGFEYLSKLPGTLGGLLKMNAGMKDDEIFQNLIKIKFANGYLAKEKIDYGYRFTNIKDVIYEAVFKIEQGYDQKKAQQFKLMRKNQPSLPSAGSVFKNPKGDFAGRLIQEAGLKGYQIGNLSFSKVHANFLVNHGNGTFQDAITLIELAKKRVYNKFKIKLKEEIIII